MARLDDLEVFYGASTHAEAHIYARLPRPSAEPSLTLTGCVRGPECDYSRTLTCSTAIRDLGPGPVLLGRAAVPDPCFWSPELPALYRVVVELRRDRTILEATERQIGIRQFGPRGRSLFLGGRRWVPRGVYRRQRVSGDLRVWREATALMVEHSPSDAL